MSYKLKSKRSVFQTEKQKPTGREILENIMNLKPAENYELFLKKEGREFEPIQLNEVVDLSQQGIEVFRVDRREEVPYLLDAETYSTYMNEITPKELLEQNGYSPNKFYLKQIKGNIEITYKDDVEHLISLDKPNMEFITCTRGPATVS